MVLLSEQWDIHYLKEGNLLKTTCKICQVNSTCIKVFKHLSQEKQGSENNIPMSYRKTPKGEVFTLLGAGGQSILTAAIWSSEKARSSIVLKAQVKINLKCMNFMCSITKKDECKTLKISPVFCNYPY